MRNRLSQATGDPDAGARVCTVPPRPGFPATPAWLRSAILGTDGTVYAPAAAVIPCPPRPAAWPERWALLVDAAREQGIPVVTFDGHPFMPTGWLASEFPDSADAVRTIEHVTRRHFAAESN
jgi:hypothetical protein